MPLRTSLHVADNEGLDNAWVPLTQKDIADIFSAFLSFITI